MPDTQNDVLGWLQEFYFSFCNGDWEHEFGPTITTLDNPGWAFDFPLKDTYLEDALFSEMDRITDDDNDWVICRVEAGVFKGRGGPSNLIELISIFRDWVKQIPEPADTTL